MNFKKLLSLLIAAALLLAIVPMGFSVSAEAEESREARIEKLISFSERLHEMESAAHPRSTGPRRWTIPLQMRASSSRARRRLITPARSTT